MKRKTQFFPITEKSCRVFFEVYFYYFFIRRNGENETKQKKVKKCLCENIKLYEFIVITSYWKKRRNTDFYRFFFKHKSIFSKFEKSFSIKEMTGVIWCLRIKMWLWKTFAISVRMFDWECKNEFSDVRKEKLEKCFEIWWKDGFTHSVVTFSDSNQQPFKKTFFTKRNQTIIILLRTF